MTPLHWAARSGRLEVVQFLVENGSNIEATTFLGTTPLTLACDSDFSDELVKVISYLLEKGANVNHKESADQSSALHFAAQRKNSLKIVELLLKHGANINVVNSEGNTPLDCVLKLQKYGGYDNIIELLKS